LSIIKDLAHDYPISAIRKPAGPVWRAAQSNRLPSWQRRLERSLVRPALAWGRARSRSFLGPDRVRLLCPDRPVTEYAVAAQLAAAPRGLTEYVCHPGSLRTQYEGRGQEAIVTSPTVRDAITQAKLELMSYRDLAEGS
jgi:hypothetical protein